MKSIRAVTGCLALATAVSAPPGNVDARSAEVRLSVSIADGADYRIESDGAGPYVDGQDGVRARLDQYGNLIVSFSEPRRGPGRLVWFDYSCPFDAVTSQPACGVAPADPPSGFQASSYISTVCASDAWCVAIQTMQEGTQQCVQLNWQFTAGQGRSWRNGFHRNRDLPNQQGTAYAVITRTTTDEWTVEPSSAACQTGSAGVARTFHVESVKSRWLYTDYGLFWLPFRLTLTRLG